MLLLPCPDVAASVVIYMKYAHHVRKLHAGLLAVWSGNMMGITTTEGSCLTSRTRSVSPDPGSRRGAMTRVTSSLESN
jgi:hypothetical protein